MAEFLVGTGAVSCSDGAGKMPALHFLSADVLDNAPVTGFKFIQPSKIKLKCLGGRAHLSFYAPFGWLALAPIPHAGWVLSVKRVVNRFSGFSRVHKPLKWFAFSHHLNHPAEAGC